MSEDGNMQQRVFGAIPLFPGEIDIADLYESLPFDRRSIQKALARLSALKFVELVAGRMYRRLPCASEPPERRGGARAAAGRPRRKP